MGEKADLSRDQLARRVAVPAKASSEEMERTLKLLTELQGLRGRCCKRCESELCHHETLFSLSMGFKNTPLCCACLADEFEREPVQMRDELWSFVLHRPCHRAGWAWANREEGYDPGALPGCLWPYPVNGQRFHEVETLEETSKSDESDVWDAGSMACGELVLELRMRLRQMKPHQVLRITAADPGAREDIPAWCRMTGHALLRGEHPQYWIERKED
jgi:tRNA 2-thiouridine synthesizing protein A